MFALVFLLGVMWGPGSVEPAASSCPTENGKSCVFPFKVNGKGFVNFCQSYNNKHYCATALKSDGTYSTWAYCDSTKCPLKESDVDKAFNPLPSGAQRDCYNCLAARAGVCAQDCFPVDDSQKCFSCVFQHSPGCLSSCGFPTPSRQFCSKTDFCPKSGMTTVFSQPGELELTRDTLLATLLTLGKEWEISFQFKPTNYDNSDWTNLIHMTVGGNLEQIGDRTPAIFFKPDVGMQITTAIGATPNFRWNDITPPPVGEWSTLTLTQLKSGASTTFSVTINGVAPFRPVVNPTPQEFSNVKVFASDPFYPAQPGLMKNLVIKTSV